MSWHYLKTDCENSHFSQEQEGAFLEDCCTDGVPLLPLRSKITHAVFCSNGKLTASYLAFLSGTTFAHSTASRGEDSSMSSAEDSPARTYQQQQQATEICQDWKVNPAAYGLSFSASFAKYDPDTFLWRTHQCSLWGGWESFCQTWPRWGIMRDGVCWEQTLSDSTTKEIGSGSKQQNKTNISKKLLPTPIATDWKGGTTATRKDRGTQRLDQWRDYVKIKYGMTYPHPTHSELRMGWITEWTDLKPLEMDKYHKWLHSHGRY